MKKLLGICCITILISSGDEAFAQKMAMAQKAALAQHASIVKFDELAGMMSRQNDTTYIFNFFATWCQPCVEEFPSFQRFSARYANRKMRLIFVSLDFRKDYQKALLPFLKKNHVTNEAVLLDEPDYNSWIDKVDSTWDGNLPATLVINNGRHIRKMFAQEFSYDSLASAVVPFIQGNSD